MTTTASSPPQAHLGPVGRYLAHGLSQRWWVLLLRGLAAIAFGVLAFLWPGLTVISLAIAWGAYVFVDGVMNLSLAITLRDGGVGQRWWLALIGVLELAAGAVAFATPLLVAKTLLMFIAAWAIVMGVFQIIGAIRLRKEITGEWMLVLSGLISVVFGGLLIARPGVGALSVVWIIGVYAIVAGVLYVGLAFRVRALKSLF